MGRVRRCDDDRWDDYNDAWEFLLLGTLLEMPL